MKNSTVLLYWNTSGILFLIAVLLNGFNRYNEIKWLSWLFYLTLVLFFAASFRLGKQFRCPHCGKFIHPGEANLPFCPHCGEKIRED